MKKFHFLYYLCFFFFFAACNKEDSIEKYPTIVNKYDPALPVAFDRIKPTYGKIDQTFVIEGNFKGELSNLKVYFGTKKAILVATDGQSITGIVPKQPAGYNKVSVVCGTDSFAPAAITFKYSQKKSVITIAGKFNDDEYVDGSLDAARFSEVHNIATVKGVKGDNIIAVEMWWRDRIRLISLDDNKVITLATGLSGGTPAVDKSREKFYIVGNWDSNHSIYSFSRSESWAQKPLDIKISQQDVPDHIFSCQLGKDERYLYTLGANGEFVEVDLNTKKYKMITLQGDVPTKFGDRSQLCYSKYHDCFFASFPNESGIFKFYNDNGTWRSVKYAGFNGAGAVFGDRLKDAKFIEPMGMTVNDDGEIYVVCRGGGWYSGSYIVKIAGNQVELVAGKPGANGVINGDPLDARFQTACDIAVDSDGNFYIAGGQDRTVRKLSIE